MMESNGDEEERGHSRESDPKDNFNEELYLEGETGYCSERPVTSKSDVSSTPRETPTAVLAVKVQIMAGREQYLYEANDRTNSHVLAASTHCTYFLTLNLHWLY